MIKRGPQRRQRGAAFLNLMLDRRRAAYDRRGRDPVRTFRGATRPGANEPAPNTERRHVPEGGLE